MPHSEKKVRPTLGASPSVGASSMLGANSMSGASPMLGASSMLGASPMLGANNIVARHHVRRQNQRHIKAVAVFADDYYSYQVNIAIIVYSQFTLP